jgi:hypothetical protein
MSKEEQKREGVVARLELRYHSEDRCYFLLGHPVINGCVIECLRTDGVWTQGTFMWSARDNEEPLLIAGDVGQSGSIRISMNSETLLRWPITQTRNSRLEQIRSDKTSASDKVAEKLPYKKEIKSEAKKSN